MNKNHIAHFEDEFANGAETVEIVFGIILAVSLGAALISFQDALIDVLHDAQDTIERTFGTLALG